MAIQKEVKVIISAVDNFSTATGVFNSKALGIIKAVEGIAMALAGASIAAGVLAQKLGKDVWQSATDFHDAIYNVEAVAQSFGTTGQEIANILDDLTQKFPVTGQQAGASMQLIAQLGYGAAEELRNMSEAANILQVATGADLQTSVMGTLAILNSFNLESDEAGRIINTLAAASFSSAASIDDLGVALRYAAPIASLMGVSVEETVAALAILRDRGLEASQTGTTLRMALIQLGKETEKKTEILKKYGLTYADVNPEVVGLTGVVDAFNGKLIKGSDAAVLFGTRSVAMANVINLGSKAFRDYRDSITGTNAAQDAYAKKLETWIVVQKNVAGSIDLFKKTLAGDLVPEILHVIGTTEDEGIRGIINWLTEMEKNLGGVNDVFKDAFADIKNIVSSTFDDSVGSVQGLYEWIVNFATILSENFKLLLEWGSMWVEIGVKSIDSGEKIRNVLTIVNQAFFLLSYSVAVVHDAVTMLYNSWVDSINLVFHPLETLEVKIKSVLLAVLKLVDMSPWNDLSGEIGRMEADIAALEAGLKPKASYWMDDVVMKFAEVQGKIEGIGDPADRLKSKLNYADVMNENIEDVNHLRDVMSATAEDTRSSLEKMWEHWTIEEKIQKLSDYIGEDGLRMIDLDNIDSAEDKLKALQDAAANLDTSDETQRDSLNRLDEYEDKLEKIREAEQKTIDQLVNYAKAGDVTLFDASDIESTSMMIHSLKSFAERMDTSKESTRESLDALNAYEKGLISTVETQDRVTEDMVTELVKVNGKWIEMETSVKKVKQEVIDLDKPLDQMSDREFTLYTKEFEAKLDMIKITAKEAGETLRVQLRAKADVEIAEAEAAAKRLVAAFEAAGKSIDATADATKSMFSDLTGLLGGDKWLSSTTKSWLQKQVEAQMQLQADALQIQKDLSAAEIRNLDAKTQKIKDMNKEAMITVEGDGLKPHLEAMMWEVFEAIQIRATEEGLDKLLLGGALT